MNNPAIRELKITFLAPQIKKLFDQCLCSTQLCKTFKTNSDDIKTEDFLHKWNSNFLNLDGLPEDCSSQGWFSECLFRIFPLLQDLPQLLTPCAMGQLSLKWTGMESVLLEAIEQIMDPGVVNHLSALLQVSAVTECILGQVFLLKGTILPFLLRDLLHTQELKKLLGKELVSYLRVLMGSVFGLNIRNIAWHGFLGIWDIHREHVALILLGLHWCGEQLQKQNLEISPPLHPHLEKAFSSCSEGMKIFPPEKGDSLEIISESPFVYTVVVPLWEAVIDLISRGQKKALLLMLPLIENALRILYAQVNSCPLESILTATDSAFYVTMDEILHPWCSVSLGEQTEKWRLEPCESPSSATSPAGQIPNLVPLYLGRQLTQAFYDLFHHTAGPRLRDRVSHGELNYNDVPFSVVKNLYCLCLLVLSVPRWRFRGNGQPNRFSIVCGCAKIPTEMSQHCNFHYSNEAEEYLKSFHFNSMSPVPQNNYLVSSISDYEGKFHPISFIKQNLIEVVSDLQRWELWVGSLPPEYLVLCSNDRLPVEKVLNEWRLPFAHYIPKQRDHIDEIYSSLLNTSFTTIFFSKVELEIIRILQQITTNILKALDNIHLSLTCRQAALMSKRLRSRQRDSYLKQIENLPTIVSHFLIIAQMVLFIFSVSDCWRSTQLTLNPLKMMLKKNLKIVENLVTFTEGSVNKYQETVEMLQQNTEIINLFFTF